MDFRAVHDPTPKIGQELVGRVAVPLTDPVGDDRFPVRVDPDEDVLIAKLGAIGRLDPLLFLADVSPTARQAPAVDLDSYIGVKACGLEKRTFL